MKLNKLHKALLAFFVFMAIFANIFVSVSMATHTCTGGQCYPCMLLDKLRDTYRLGAAIATTISIIFIMFFAADTLREAQKGHTYNLVTLKVRMNT
ncbi:MAG: hypothetical protein FWE42_00455 [Defluviitaleaceae bacterium]|nr:hypothetical protein [Defluviitaleaceae bacterium]